MKKKKGQKKLFYILLPWLVLISYIIIFPPGNTLLFFIFYLFLFIALSNTIHQFRSLVKSILWAAIIIVFLLLRQFRIENIINLILLLSILVTFEVYFRKM